MGKRNVRAKIGRRGGRLRPRHPSFIDADYEKFDAGLRKVFKRAIGLLNVLLDDVLAISGPAHGERKYLGNWAIFYGVVVRDICESIAKLLADGRHTRAVLMLRRSVFEYTTRYAYYRKHPNRSKRALDDWYRLLTVFISEVPAAASSLGGAPADPEFDELAHEPFKDAFKEIMEDIYGKEASSEMYATLYRIPSSLLHGSALITWDILSPSGASSPVGAQIPNIHLDSRRPFTNQFGANLIIVMLEFLQHVNDALGFSRKSAIDELRCALDAARKRIGEPEEFWPTSLPKAES